MDNIQEWLAPLLTFLGSAATLVAGWRLFHPVRELFRLPKQLKLIMEKLDGHSEQLTSLTLSAENSDGIQMSLLRDRLVQAKNHYSEGLIMPENVYQTLCGMYAAYKQDGGNSYIDSVMESIHEIYSTQQTITLKQHFGKE